MCRCEEIYSDLEAGWHTDRQTHTHTHTDPDFGGDHLTRCIRVRWCSQKYLDLEAGRHTDKQTHTHTDKHTETALGGSRNKVY